MHTPSRHWRGGGASIWRQPLTPRYGLGSTGAGTGGSVIARGPSAPVQAFI